jgi:anthranilate synthase/aminodeoxychorismate synthase-like glutamine amidotransferase
VILLIDNFDSFTYNLVDYIKQAGADVVVMRNDALPEDINVDHFTGVVLSPGPGIPEKAGNLYQLARLFYGVVPVLGICLGHQAICAHFGGQIVRALKPMHGKQSVIRTRPHHIFNNLPTAIGVVRYHSLVCTQLPDVLEVIADTAEGEVMGVAHKYLPICGLQFHPEAVLTEYGLDMIRNWVNTCDRQ